MDWQQWGLVLQLNVQYIDGLMQERRNSSALAMELRLSCMNPSIWQCYITEYIENKIWIKSEQTVYALRRVLFWYLFPKLWSKEGITLLNNTWEIMT